jgi:hypothetical protein
MVMMNRFRAITLLTVSSFFLTTLLATGCKAAALTASPEDTTQITVVVEAFGRRLQLVSLLSPTAADDIRSQYADYIAPTLLDQWAADPAHAPGRMTSSPWPDRIEISSLTKISTGLYAVSGEIVEVTSVEANPTQQAAGATPAAAVEIPVQMTVEQDAAGAWKITSFQQG